MNTPVSHLSGLELTDLIKNHIQEILGKEKQNLSAMYLYRTGAYWIAFEQSAYRLASLCKTISIVPMKILGIPAPVVTAGLKDDNFREVVKGLCVVDWSRTRIIYLMPEDLNDEAYEMWHQKKTKEILRFMRKGLLRGVS